MTIRSSFNRHNNPARSFKARFYRPSLCTLEDRAIPAVVGYYDMGLGQGNSSQVQPILTAGHTPIQLFNLTAADLDGIDVLFVQNANNGGYDIEYMNNLPSIEAAVAGGMTLIIHDRFVDGAESILPGGTGFNIIRDFSDGSNINVLDDTTLLTNGPGGIITDATLDGGFYSDHGFAFAGSLPADARLILTTGDPTHIVTFSYSYGFGNVVYSSIPLDAFLSMNLSPSAIRDIYAPNVVEYGVDLVNIDPNANPSEFEIDEDGVFEGQLIADDADGDPLTFSICTGPKHGTVQLVNTSTGAYIYTTATNFSGTDSFAFTVTDPRGGTATATVTLTINAVNDAPTVDAGPDMTLKVKKSGSFTALASDPDGDELNYSWNLGDGTLLSGMNVTHAFASPGDYTVVLTVDDGHGGVASDTMIVTVEAAAPVLSIRGPTEGRPGQLVKFSAEFTEGTPPGRNKMIWYVVNPKGRVIVVKMGTKFQFRPGMPGSYTIICKVINKDGVIAESSHELTVRAAPKQKWK